VARQNLTPAAGVHGDRVGTRGDHEALKHGRRPKIDAATDAAGLDVDHDSDDNADDRCARNYVHSAGFRLINSLFKRSA
jgi:hypothetical protein